MSWHTWYEEHYPELMGHGLWLRGGEINTLPPEEYDRRAFRVQFTRLSTYFDTGYSFTHQFLYQLAADTDGVFPDLSYLPPKGDAAVMARDQVPWLLGTQTKLGPEKFDLIGFSNSIVQELINLPTFLSKSGIPLKKSERMARPDLPLIIMGGANALYSSVTWDADPLVDGVFVGESEKAIRRILEICRDGKKMGLTKPEILKLLEGVQGFFEPESPRNQRKGFIWDLNKSEALTHGPVYYLEDQLGNSHLQISEGCPCFCSFCAESWDRKPYRERGPATLREVALRAKASMGLDQIDIYSFNFNMHSGFYEILWDLVPNFRAIGLKSQRFDLLAHDPQMTEFQHAIEKSSVTCGLEGISPRLRKYLHKNLETEQLHQSLTAIFKSKAREVKIFMIATGYEEEQDFEALEDFVEHLKEIQQTCRSTARVIFSMTPLVRFPWTPLEFEDAPQVGQYDKIIAKASARIRRGGFEFRESADLPEYWVSQILVRASDPRVTAAMLAAVAKTGFVYYRTMTEGFMLALREALHREGLDPEALMKGFDLEASRAKPWAVIETGVKREFLWEEVERARKFVEIDYCLGRKWTKAKCFHCGGCPTRFHVRDIVLSTQTRNYTLEQFKARIKTARQGEVEVRLHVDVGPASRGVPRKMFAVALARALMLTDSRLVEGYRGFRGAYWSDGDKPTWVTGDDAVTLAFDRSRLEALEETLGSAEKLHAINHELGAWGTLRGRAGEKWVPGVAELSSPYGAQVESYLKKRDLKFTLRKRGEGQYAYEFIPQSLKKGLLKSLRVQNVPTGARVLLEPGPKFAASDFAEFAQVGFRFPKPQDWVRVRVAAGTFLAASDDGEFRPN